MAPKKAPSKKKTKIQKDKKFKLNMPFEDAMKKLANPPLGTKKTKK